MSKETVEIKMLETTKGCDNDLGKYHPEEYLKGETYTVGLDLAEAFKSTKVAEGAKKTKKKAAPKSENKEDKADENKEEKGDEDK